MKYTVRFRATENTIVRTRAGVSGDEIENGMKLRETVRGGEGADDEEERRVIMAEGVDSGGPSEDVEVVMGELGVVVEFGFEEVEE